MNKNLTNLKNDLVELADVVNGFTSESVQLKVIEAALEIILGNKIGPKPTETVRTQIRTGLQEAQESRPRKKPGATKILNQVLHTDYFDQVRTIAEIAKHCLVMFESEFKTSELSGILLKLANERKLIRTRDTDNNRFVYSKPAVK